MKAPERVARVAPLGQTAFEGTPGVKLNFILRGKKCVGRRFHRLKTAVAWPSN